MGRKPNFHLTSAQRQRLRSFMAKTNDKREYRAADGLLQRAEGKSADEVARRLGVTIKQVFTWTRKFRASGTDGLHMKKPTGRKTTKADAAKPIIAKIIDEEPQAFGYLKGRWALFVQEEDGIRDGTVTGVQTCALPICHLVSVEARHDRGRFARDVDQDRRR